MNKYSTRLNGLKVFLQQSSLASEKPAVVVFDWEPRVSLPLTDKQKTQIESNCKWYISGGGFKNRLYPKTQDEKIPEQLPPSNQGRYISIVASLKGEF